MGEMLIMGWHGFSMGFETWEIWDGLLWLNGMF